MDPLKLHQRLLDAWDARSAPSGGEQFSVLARQRIAVMCLEFVNLSGAGVIDGGQQAGQDDESTELVDLAIDDGLALPGFCAELRVCQLALLDIIMADALDAGNRKTALVPDEALQSVTTLLSNLDAWVLTGMDKFVERGDVQAHSAPSTDVDTGTKKKTLQHEIRTPLQGALLTTELMLEDAGQGDAVSADDILAVRKSIETAVGILNDFANRSTPE